MHIQILFATFVLVSCISMSESCWWACCRCGKRDVSDSGTLPLLPCDFTFFDKNKDGILTKSEFKTGTQNYKAEENKKNSIFAELDTDGDGTVTLKEFDKNAKSLESEVFKPCVE